MELHVHVYGNSSNDYYSLSRTVLLFHFSLSREYIIDPCSIERNRILVATTYIGGPNERVLPPHYLLEASTCNYNTRACDLSIHVHVHLHVHV